MDGHSFSDKRLVALICVAVLFTAGLALYGPIPQSNEYYQFADHRSFFGIPNFFDVVSNFPFLLVGIYGLLLFRKKTPSGSIPSLRYAYLTLFIGASLVAFGSGYFHLNPNDSTLVWDRLPMTISFMSFVTIIIGEYFDDGIARKLLAPLLFIGLFSVVWWRFTDNNDGGDLRIYILVQFLPMLLIPYILWLYPATLVPTSYVWGLLGMYVLAKVFESLDESIFQLLRVISGHTLKHVAAALGVLIFGMGLVRRRHGAARLVKHGPERRSVMERKFICVLFAVVLLIPSMASAAAQQQDFLVQSTADIVDLCTTAPDDPLYTAAIHFCHGYLVGAYAYYAAQAAGPEGDRLVCFSDPPPSRNDAVGMYVSWAKAHPEQMNAAPVETLFMFLTEKWPCKK